LVMTAVNAAARGFGRSPEPLVTDCLLRAGELAEAVGRAVAFDAAHDRLCAPGRLSVHTAPQRPPLSSPAADYAAQASVGSVLGAVATAVLKRSGRDAVEAVLAGSPLPARSGHSAFSSALGWHLARS